MAKSRCTAQISISRVSVVRRVGPLIEPLDRGSGIPHTKAKHGAGTSNTTTHLTFHAHPYLLRPQSTKLLALLEQAAGP
jgi:hypothetical protein